MNTLGKIPKTATATYAYMMKCEFKFNLVVGSSLAHMSYEMPIRNVVTWNMLIAGKAQNGYSKGVLD